MEPINTVENILKKLNEDAGASIDTPIWLLIEGVHALPVISESRVNLMQNMVMQGFINTQTAEIRFYLAKLVEGVPGREKL